MQASIPCIRAPPLVLSAPVLACSSVVAPFAAVRVFPSPNALTSVMLAALAAALALAPPALPPIGTALEQAVSAEAVLVASTRIAAPGPPFAPAHLAQDVHQQKRQQHACNGLARLDRLLTGGARIPREQQKRT